MRLPESETLAQLEGHIIDLNEIACCTQERIPTEIHAIRCFILNKPVKSGHVFVFFLPNLELSDNCFNHTKNAAAHHTSHFTFLNLS